MAGVEVPSQASLSLEEDLYIVHQRELHMRAAMAVRESSNCAGRRVGALVVRDGRPIVSGSNMTPHGTKHCRAGGCRRCENRDKKYKSGTAYDKYICVHAEQHCITTAACNGLMLEGSDIYTTLSPCLGCAKELLEVGVRRVYYVHLFETDDAMEAAELEKLYAQFEECVRVNIDDPRADWARMTTK